MVRNAGPFGRVTCLVALLVTLFATLPVDPVRAQDDQATDRAALDWIVGLRDGPGFGRGASALKGTTGDATVTSIGPLSSALLIKFHGHTTSNDAIARLLQNPAIAYVEPDLIYQWQYEPNDKYFQQQAWAATSRLPDAWSIATGQASTLVAVLDSGVRLDHPDLAGQTVPGYDFFNDDDNPMDDVGHGTAVAGIIGARGNDSVGIAGTAMSTRLLPVKVGNKDGAPVSDISKGVYYAVNQGASVINMSLGSDTPSPTLEDAIKFAYDRNVAVVAASGNRPDRPSFPASYRQTISVGAATTSGEYIAEFSSRISRVDLSAPGVDVLAPYWDADAGNLWAWVSGTSFAAPVVSGTVALLRSVQPGIEIEQIRAILTETSRGSFQGQGGGAGLLDAGAALRRTLLVNFAGVWQPADQPVAAGAAQRTWLWGPNAFLVGLESYVQSQQGQRMVVYYDKARMEITNPYADRRSIWYVTNGLLVSELISGRVQTGDAEFEPRRPAEIPVAGDPDDTTGPLYATFAGLTGAPALPEAGAVIQTLTRGGAAGSDERLRGYGVTATDFIPETGHRVASVFRDYLNSSGLVSSNGEFHEGKLFDPTYYATGYPIIEAYWSTVKVAGQPQDVLVQCFERRCLTFTPANADGWKVEMGNVGQHYYRWRFGQPPAGPAPEDPTGLIP